VPEQTILVVEDDDMLRSQIIRSLAQHGYTMLEATTGHETIRLLESRKIDLVVTDRKMPWMDGDWLVGYVRTNYPKIPIIVATAFPQDHPEFTPDATLIKPFTLDDLKQTINTFLPNPGVSSP
jgi:two-component system response regulator FlrC